MHLEINFTVYVYVHMISIIIALLCLAASVCVWCVLQNYDYVMSVLLIEVCIHIIMDLHQVDYRSVSEVTIISNSPVHSIEKRGSDTLKPLTIVLSRCTVSHHETFKL